MKIKYLSILNMCFCFIVLPSILLGLCGFLLIGDGESNGSSLLAYSLLLFSICNIIFWVKSFISPTAKSLSQITQAVLIVCAVLGLAFSFMQFYAGNVVSGIIGFCYIVAIAVTSLNYFYHRAVV